MATETVLLHQETRPTRRTALIFRGKATLLQLRRAWLNEGRQRVARQTVGEKLSDAPVLGESVTPLWNDGNAHERALQAGKVHNLRTALRAIHGVEMPAGGLPVVASAACGLADTPGIVTVPTGDTDALTQALQQFDVTALRTRQR